MDNPGIILLHGAWHSAKCWDLLIPPLEALQHPILRPDLPGHGDNPAEIDDITLKLYSRYISQYIDKYDKKVILVGHSMSGLVISQVAEAIPHQIERLVYLSAYLPRNGQSLFDLISENSSTCHPAPIEEAMLMTQDKRVCTIAEDKIKPLFYNRCEDGLASHIPDSFPAQATLPLAGKVSLTEEKFGSIPRTYICCLDDQVIPIDHQRNMMKNQPCDEMIQLDSDHSPFLSCPELLASILHSISLPA